MDTDKPILLKTDNNSLDGIVLSCFGMTLKLVYEPPLRLPIEQLEEAREAFKKDLERHEALIPGKASNYIATEHAAALFKEVCERLLQGLLEIDEKNRQIIQQRDVREKEMQEEIERLRNRVPFKKQISNIIRESNAKRKATLNAGTWNDPINPKRRRKR